MPKVLIALTSLIIPINTKPSSMVEVGTLANVCIFGPATLTGAINIQVSPDNTNWYDLKSGGSNIAVAASGAVVVTNGGFRYLRVNSASDEGAARTFVVSMQEDA